MARETAKYKLWQHEPKAPKKAEAVVIAKMRPTAVVSRSPMSALPERARGVRSASGASAPALTRLLENGRVTRIAPVFEEAPSVSRAPSGVFSATERSVRARARNSSRIVEIDVSRDTNARQLAAHIARMEDVEYAFVPPVRRLFRRRSTALADPLASRLWGHGAIRLGHARAAAGFDNAAGVTVAVVDSGIDAHHPDLKNAIADYQNFLGGSRKDFVGHGTHVAGIIAATAGNGLGISGVCGAKILALKALPRDGEEFSPPAYYRALRYVIGRAQVLNLSLGGEKDEAEIDILRDVIDAGVVVVAAMGNEYEEGNPVEYPAAMREVCAVGATNELDTRGGFSNTGRHIDLVAPGVAILSTTPTFRYDGDDEMEYDAWDGTSMATPHVAGAAALLLARSPGLTPAQVIARLTGSADRVAGAKKGSRAYGAGRLNCERLLR
jgi:subtilisin family serine protease